MKLIVTLERDEMGVIVAECPAIPGLRFPGQNGRRGDGQHSRGHPGLCRSASRQWHAPDDLPHVRLRWPADAQGCRSFRVTKR